MRVKIFTSYPIGYKCREWAKDNLPEGYELTNGEADIIISVLYNKLFPPEITKKECFNFHCGILPQYRGVGIFTWAIINGEKEFGITLHKIDENIDTGDIIKIEKFEINKKETAKELFDRAMEVVYKMFKEWFVKIITGDYQAQKQPQKGKTYYRKDLNKAKDLTRYLRAFTFKDKEGCYYWKNNKKIYL